MRSGGSGEGGQSFIVVFAAPGPVPQGTPPHDTARALDVVEGRVASLTFACPDRSPAQFLQEQHTTSFLVPPR